MCDLRCIYLSFLTPYLHVLSSRYEIDPPPSPPPLTHSLVELEFHRELNTPLDMLRSSKTLICQVVEFVCPLIFHREQKSFEQLFLFLDFWPFSAFFGHFQQMDVTYFAHGEKCADIRILHPDISGFKRIAKFHGVYLVPGSPRYRPNSTTLLFLFVQTYSLRGTPQVML